MYYVVSNLVMPLTRSRRLSYAELAGPNKVNWFISHFWGTSFRHFVFSIRKHAESVAVVNNYIGNWADRTYWICSLSNNQWNVAEEVGQSWEESSFYLTLTCGYCAGTAMILDDEAMPLTRAWCLFEVLQTKEIGDRQNSFEGLWLCTATGVLHKGKAGVDVAMRIAERLSTLKLEDATASVQKDKDMKPGTGSWFGNFCIHGLLCDRGPGSHLNPRNGPLDSASASCRVLEIVRW
ncbi:unnamed protein product [Symbiodinium necroappetens]|uniref:Uncharacterized protein n=1 Tax=Symbiodinium necroappetens TaxID=1628268 RepID=A0A812VZX9_9DINO|nr:unnamed protein product [Symbiodinium necroappetens]